MLAANKIAVVKFGVDTRNIFTLSVSYVQDAAMKRLGRELTDDELDGFRKGLEAGLFIAADISIDSMLDDLRGA